VPPRNRCASRHSETAFRVIVGTAIAMDGAFNVMPHHYFVMVRLDPTICINTM
jgi:hypothetical protein